MKRLRIGIVGLGRVASKTHIPVLRATEGVDVVAGAEKNRERAERVKKLFGLQDVYEDYEAMYASARLDAVYVCLPNFLHRDACIKALNSGLHVLCEKPMGMSVAEAEEMTRLAEDRNLVLMPGYKKRYAPNFGRARQTIENGLLGRIIHVQGTFVTPGPYISWDPKSDWYLDERWHGVVYDSGCHLAELLFYLVPQKVQEVRAILCSGFNGYSAPTNLACSMQMEGGITGNLLIGWRASTDVLSLSVHGTAGTLTVSRDSYDYVNPGTDPIDKILQDVGAAYRGCKALSKKLIDKMTGSNFYEEDLIQARSFCAAVRGEGAAVSGWSAVRVHEVLQKIIASGIA